MGCSPDQRDVLNSKKKKQDQIPEELWNKHIKNGFTALIHHVEIDKVI